MPPLPAAMAEVADVQSTAHPTALRYVVLSQLVDGSMSQGKHD